MTEGSTPPPGGTPPPEGSDAGQGRLRIGNAERTAAMKALDAHLEAGRLGVEEYGDRSAAAAGASVVSELEALFTDLPEPHPDLPGSSVALTKPAAAPLLSPAAVLAAVQAPSSSPASQHTRARAAHHG